MARGILLDNLLRLADMKVCVGLRAQRVENQFPRDAGDGRNGCRYTATEMKAATKGYNPLAPARVGEILARLDKNYPGVTCALHHNSAWELVVATILSAQCTDVRVNIVTPVLFKKYPTVQDFARLKPEQLEPDIRTTGFFRNKAKSVVGAAKKVVEDFGGEVPEEMDQLLTLPGWHARPPTLCLAAGSRRMLALSWIRTSRGFRNGWSYLPETMPAKLNRI